MDSPTAYISPKNFDLVEIISGPKTVLFERATERFSEPSIKVSFWLALTAGMTSS
ncbi:hypothetical protein [Scandinavium sp. UTDF21-P1B]|uniref:hypothetical protein n=1 Tax=Scandinavium sp. UTDF21-P1B TaxID=3446379 RepID=UPI003F4A8253